MTSAERHAENSGLALSCTPGTPVIQGIAPGEYRARRTRLALILSAFHYL